MTSRGQDIKDNFAQLAKLLDARHDKHEAIFKQSRDITVDSKRLIFAIHRLFDQKDRTAGFQKIHNGLNDIGKLWTKMGKLFEDVSDPNLFLRAFSPGLQEFIEALCFLSVLESSYLPSCDEILQKTSFPHLKEILFAEILLGIADITGEIMRFVTNMASKGNNDFHLPARDFLQKMYLEYLRVPSEVSRELNRKIHAHKGSMIKVEFLCYTSMVQSKEQK